MKPHAHPPQSRLATTLRSSLAAATAFLLLLMSQGEVLAQQAPYYGQPQQYAYNQPTYSQPTYAPQQYPQQQYPQQPGYPEQPCLQQGYPQPGGQPSYQPGYNQPAPQGLGAPQLEQLVAPIALYPDTLVAQVLTASTYPAQVADADRWRRSQPTADPYDLAVAADAQPWDPSIKGLTAFPQVLALMDQNQQWTTALGAAYFNQPQDVLQAVQVLRQRAQAAGNLQSGPQEQVSDYQGGIALAPANPQVIYVPTYNPWTVYGAPLAPYPGFSLLGALGSFFGSALSAGLGGGLGGGIGASPISFGLGIAMAAFTHMPWGWLGWGLSWLAHSVLFHQSTYFTHSTMVADWGLPHGGPRAFAGSRDYRGAPVNYRSPVNYRAGYDYRGTNGYRGGNDYRGGAFNNRPAFNGREADNNRDGYASNQNLARTSAFAGVRPGEAYRPANNGYGSSFNGRPAENYTRPTENYGARPGTAFAGSNQSYRGAEPNFARNEAPRSNNSFMSRNEAPRSEHFGSFKEPKAPKAPRGFGGGKVPKAPKAPKGGGGHGSGGKHHF
jgi:Protein of unknown function (DUF3300)